MKERVVWIARNVVEDLALEREPDADRRWRRRESRIVMTVSPADAPAAAIERDTGHDKHGDLRERNAHRLVARLAQSEPSDDELARGGLGELERALALHDLRIRDPQPHRP